MGNNTILVIFLVIIGGFTAVWFGSGSVDSAQEEIELLEEQAENKQKLEKLQSKYNKALKKRESDLSKPKYNTPAVSTFTKLSPKAAKDIKSGAIEMLEAIPKSDIKTVVDKTYPGIFLALKISKAEFTKILKEAFSIYVDCTDFKYRISDPLKLYSAGANKISILPIEIIAELSNGKKIQSNGALIAVSGGFRTAKWTYFDSMGVSQNPNLLWEMFPLLSRDFKIPETVYKEI